MSNIAIEIGNVVVLSVGTQVIETEQLILRRFAKDDATDMFNNCVIIPHNKAGLRYVGFLL